MARYYPIIYIRGYAMTVDERNETAADPFCGFNVGSTLYRATSDKAQRPEKFVFESPLVRLTTEYGYRHVYQNGLDIMDEGWEPARDISGKVIPGIPASSIVILRYYDDGSVYLGDGKARNIEEYARRLNALILKIKQLVCTYCEPGGVPMAENDFRCYLVAHSMGGLVARAFLHATKAEYKEAQITIDKFFTFATPHNGIDVLGMNVPGWLTSEQANTFNRETMAQYLNLQMIAPKFEDRVDLIPDSAMNPDRIFCMVGTNRGDYEVLQGAVRAFVGNGSDGLVRIDNASLWGLRKDLTPVQVATAYAYRSHSGYFGIVNSEEAYQNLARFLFGDVRVGISLLVDSVSLPPTVQQEINSGQKLEAGYQFEFRAAPKGKRWFLTRRQAVEDSPACRSHEELTGADNSKRTVYLSSVFLSRRGKVDEVDRTLSYVMTFAAKVPDYIINRRFWPDAHYEGTDLFRGTAIVKVTPPPPEKPAGIWNVRLAWMEDANSTVTLDVNFGNQSFLEIDLPFDQPKAPGIKGKLRLKVRPWE